jgi:hypothetical protein
MHNTELERATCLLKGLIAKAMEGNASVCTYAFAYKFIFLEKPEKWSQAYNNKLLNIATKTPTMKFAKLGQVHLDTFIVGKETAVPGEGHWGPRYSKQDWLDVLGAAKVLG